MSWRKVNTNISSPTEDTEIDTNVSNVTSIPKPSDEIKKEKPKEKPEEKLEEEFKWPNFCELKGQLDFSDDNINSEKKHLLILYLISEEISTVKIANLDYMLQLFYMNETKLLQNYKKNKSSIKNEKVCKLMKNRAYLKKEIISELGISTFLVEKEKE